MIDILLPDGSQKQFEQPPTALQVAQCIGPRLAQSMIAAKVNDRVVDACTVVEQNAQFAVITDQSPEALDIVRHSTAHLMAHAVKILFPQAQVTIGPVIDDGFYYDFACEQTFSEEDLVAIEKHMMHLVQQKIPITRLVWEREQAMDFFRGIGEHYKVQIIESIPEHEPLSLYQQGDFIDVCRGPHVPNTGCLGAFKLTKLAGAYWRGDPGNPMLQRIYGTAFTSKTALTEYLDRMELARQRDHRLLAQKMQLFHMESTAPGMVFWHPKGWTMYQLIQGYIRTYYREHGYQEVNTPIMVGQALLERSGHWGKFGNQGIFTTQSEQRAYAIRPMNCPCHVEIYNHSRHSYKALPIRIAEFGACYRNEPSGTLHGLMRLRHFTQDDGHIFCTHDQMSHEISNFIDQVLQVYQHFGFHEVLVHLSTRPEQRIGDEALWDQAESVLTDLLNQKNLEWSLMPGEGAFYGPKIEFHLKDCLGRMWQCGTLQLDFYIPGRLNACYIDEQGKKQVPVMLHRAILGTIERFMGILLEHYADDLPFWLAPVQAVVLNINQDQADYAQSVQQILNRQNIRTQIDLRREKISYKIREHSMHRVPYMIIVGPQELKEQKISVRHRKGNSLGSMPIQEWVSNVMREEQAAN